MKLSRTTACSKIVIRSPRWKERTIGIATFRVKEHNEIEIEAKDKKGDRYYPGTYYMSGEDIRSHKVQHLKSGIDLHLVPIKELEPLERED